MRTPRQVFVGAKALLLDFDGPVTDLMPYPANADAANSARNVLSHPSLPQVIANTTDHLAVLRFVLSERPSEVPAVERACALAELHCASTSIPSPELIDFLEGANNRNQRIAVISNNNEAAVRKFAERYRFSNRIASYQCRTKDTVAFMKPHPYLVSKTLDALNLLPEECVLVGDSVSDVQAARAAGVPVVALAKNRTQRDLLLAAEPDALMER